MKSKCMNNLWGGVELSYNCCHYHTKDEIIVHAMKKNVHYMLVALLRMGMKKRLAPS